MAQAAYKLGCFTYVGYCTWSDEEPWDLIGDEAYAMSWILREVVVELVHRQIGNHLQGNRC